MQALKSRTTKVKATHKGECQFCGKIQKLPNGLIAKHGYKVIDSAFADTCLGSELPPYNNSCKEISEILIPSVQNTIDKIQTQIKNIEAETTFCYQHIYYYEARLYSWTKGEIVERLSVGDTQIGKRFEFLYDNKIRPVPAYILMDMEPVNVASVVQYFNRGYIKHLHNQLDECDRAFVLCQKRVKTWQLKPTLPI